MEPSFLVVERGERKQKHVKRFSLFEIGK